MLKVFALSLLLTSTAYAAPRGQGKRSKGVSRAAPGKQFRTDDSARGRRNVTRGRRDVTRGRRDVTRDRSRPARPTRTVRPSRVTRPARPARATRPARITRPVRPYRPARPVYTNNYELRRVTAQLSKVRNRIRVLETRLANVRYQPYGHQRARTIRQNLRQARNTERNLMQQRNRLLRRARSHRGYHRPSPYTGRAYY